MYIVPVSIVGMFCWSVFIQGYWIMRTRIWERFLFLGLAFLLVNPSHISLGGMHFNQHLVNVFAIAVMAVIYWRQRYRRRLAAQEDD
jgi:TRAP-type uncharacterized transport system fused permease subunit